MYKLSGLGLLQLSRQLEWIVKTHFSSLPAVVLAIVWEKDDWGNVT